VWLKPLWGDSTLNSVVDRDETTQVRTTEDTVANQLNEIDSFSIKTINAGDSFNNAQIYADLQFVLGVQVRL
jgi:hypothetical protein